MRRISIVALAACSSSSSPAQLGSSQAAEARDATTPVMPALALHPLALGGAPVLEIVVTGAQLVSPSDPTASYIFTFARGEARTQTGRYDTLWKEDELVGFPVAGPGMRPNPNGSWRAEIVSDIGKNALSIGSADGGRIVTRSAEPMRVVGASENGRFRLVVFSQDNGLALARTTDDYVATARWRISDLPAPATALAVTDSDGRIDIAWATEAGIRGLQRAPDHAEGKLPAPRTQPGTSIVASCVREKLWVATESALQRAEIDPIAITQRPSTIVACDHNNVLVQFADGRAQHCSTRSCKDVAIPAGAAAVFVDETPIVASYRDGVLAVSRDGKQSSYRIDGAVARVELFALGDTPVIVTFDADGTSTRWAKLPE